MGADLRYISTIDEHRFEEKCAKENGSEEN